ncbi:MAG TPA: hypothetical protein VLJ88_06645, partial [Propionibacteriaceae bacterium]|nr:hypothetical protein [Propionibacteriaceae bacterium]
GHAPDGFIHNILRSRIALEAADVVAVRGTEKRVSRTAPPFAGARFSTFAEVSHRSRPGAFTIDLF